MLESSVCGVCRMRLESRNWLSVERGRGLISKSSKMSCILCWCVQCYQLIGVMKQKQKLELYFKEMLVQITDNCSSLCVKDIPPRLSDTEKVCLNKCFERAFEAKAKFSTHFNDSITKVLHEGKHHTHTHTHTHIDKDSQSK